AHKEQANWQKAVELLKKATDSAGEHSLQPALHYELADCYVALGNVDEAQAIADTLIKRWPESPYANDIQNAVAHRSASAAKAHFNAAIEHGKNGEFKEALADLDLVRSSDLAIQSDA